MTVWKTQNKKRPGAYINVLGKGNGKVKSDLGRTLMCTHLPLNWGKKGVIKLNPSSDLMALLGHSIDDPELQVLKEVFKAAETVLLVNNNDGKPAMKNDSSLPWSFTAQHPGTKGNELHVSVQKNAGTTITVTTLFGSKIVDQQVIDETDLESLASNDYIKVDFTANKKPTMKPASSVTADLTGGTTSSVDAVSLLEEAIENEQYDVVTSAGFDKNHPIHKKLVDVVKKLRENTGSKVRGVIPDIGSKINYEGISVVNNGVILNDGTKLAPTIAAGYVAGASSAADPSTSLTYSQYPEAISAHPKLNNDKTIQALEQGHIVFTTKRNDMVVIEQDINSLVNFNDEKPQSFSKNRVVRMMDTIVNNTEQTFEQMFLGKVTNNSQGRDLFKANRVSYLQGLAEAQVIDGFDSDDISVESGDDIDSILVNLSVKPLDSMEKLYMTMVVG